MSPITPKPRGYGEIVIQPPPMPYTQLPASLQPQPVLDLATLVDWTPEMVAEYMFEAGIDGAIADRFIENDINGAILLTLKFEDLRELSIKSFGIRTRVWQHIERLKKGPDASPTLTTPIEDLPSREVRKEQKKAEEPALKKQLSTRRGRQHMSDGITPNESVSIVGIEQVIPKPHHCSKGENCSKWRRTERAIAQFKREHPNIDIQASGTVLVRGDAANLDTARALDASEFMRPYSEAINSVVASSDVMGPGMPPMQYLQEASLRAVQTRDPQDNVRQFLSFQQRPLLAGEEVPPTPPFEIISTAQPHHGLRRLPKLSIPLNEEAKRQRMGHARSSSSSSHLQRSQQVQEQARDVQPTYSERSSPEETTPKSTYRFGTPFSEMDVPVTAVPLGPIARDASQSVPPDMNYRTSNSNNFSRPRSQSRASSRRPSFPVLPAVSEHNITRQYSQTPSPQQQVSPSLSEGAQRHLQAPPRGNYPWTAADRAKFEQVLPPGSTVAFATPGAVDGVTFQGPMKKRKTRMLRHEWQDGYFTLKGTRLNMHKDNRAVDRTLEYIDIDDYAIACSNAASTSKLTAAFKAVNISSHSREKSDPVGAFSFQLIPQDKNGTRLRKRDSSVPATIPPEGVNGTGKTHHFAVKNRDERIDWMREMMLAKAMKQKGAGFEISVNGNMI